MCKVMMMAGIKPANRDNAIKFLKAMAKPMSKSNTDGLGYAAVTKDGEMFAQRWLNNGDAFTTVDTTELDLINTFSGVADAFSKVGGESTSYGTPKLDEMVAVTLHTRFATSAKGMKNTHPFIKDGVSVIHNGVINNTHEFTLEQSSCDSETILLQYVADQVNVDPSKIDHMASKLKGYYACGVLAPSETGYVLDVFKGNNDNLSFVYVVELDTMVFATSLADIIEVCQELGFKYKAPMKLKEGMLLRLDATTGNIITSQSFKVRPQYEYNYGGNYSGWEDWVNKHNDDKKKTETYNELPASVKVYYKALPVVIEEIKVVS